MEVEEEKIQYILQFFFDKDETASQVVEIVNDLYDLNTGTANSVKFWFYQFCWSIFHAKDAFNLL